MTREEMRITFWLYTDQRDGELQSKSQGAIDMGTEVLEFRRRARREALSGKDRNLYVGGSPIRKIGSERRN